MRLCDQPAQGLGTRMTRYSTECAQTQSLATLSKTSDTASLFDRNQTSLRPKLQKRVACLVADSQRGWFDEDSGTLETNPGYRSQDRN